MLMGRSSGDVDRLHGHIRSKSIAMRAPADDSRMTRSESRLTLRSPATSAPALDAPPRPEAFAAHRALTEVADWVVGALGETAGLAAAAARARSGARGFRTAQ